jgi:hypothetical protein
MSVSFVPSLTEIEHVVLYGSPFRALETGYITADRLYRYLAKQQHVTIENTIAYKALCLYLGYSPRYGVNPLFATHSTVTDCVGPQIADLIAAQVPLTIKQPDIEVINLLLIAKDRLDELTLNKKVAAMVITRMNFLVDSCVDYFQNVVYNDYYLLCKELLQRRLVPTVRQVQEIYCYFPDLIDRRILSFSQLSYAIYLQPPLKTRYLLGLEMNSSYDTLMETLLLLPAAPTVDTRDQPNQDHDMFLEPISNYGPFDVSTIIENGHKFRFTRGEFPYLIHNGRNYLTNQTLPQDFITHMQDKIRIARALGLPSPAPVKDLLINFSRSLH